MPSLPKNASVGQDELIGIFFTKGSVKFSIGERSPEILKPRDFVLLNRHQHYTIEPYRSGGSGCSIGRGVFRIDNARARLLFKLLPPMLILRQLSKEEMEWHLMLERLVVHSPASLSSAMSAINHRLIEASLIAIIQIALHRNLVLGYQFDNPMLARVASSIRAIHDAPERGWTIAELSQMAGMSRTLFGDMFKQVTGERPARYLTLLRFERALELLTQSTLPIEEIAHRAGYGTDAAFVRAFGREFGTSPGQYRVAYDRRKDGRSR